MVETSKAFTKAELKHAILDSVQRFINVPEGVQKSFPAGSSWNVEEIDAIDSGIMKLVSIGFQQNDIAVNTGYSEQKRLFTKAA